jgi:cytochrome c oxidase assembly protein subunit 15
VLLILAGGLVTSLGAGLAVPDWPTTFGYNMFLYPWSKMVGGIFYEHSHRLLGSLVGILTILTAFAFWRSDPRRWVRRLGGLAVLLVIVQGVLGGLRVVWLKLTLAIVHACAAQLFFGLMVSLVVFTSRNWSGNFPAIPAEVGRSIRRLSLITAALIYIQTIFGAVLRHTGERLDAHLLFAALVTIHVFLLAAKIIRNLPERRDLHGTATMLWVLLIIQLGLGAGSFMVKYTAVGDAVTLWTIVLLTSAHVVTGALLFATAISLALRLYRDPSPNMDTGLGELLSEQASAS